jgi:hypothetical protein
MPHHHTRNEVHDDEAVSAAKGNFFFTNTVVAASDVDRLVVCGTSVATQSRLRLVSDA